MSDTSKPPHQEPGKFYTIFVDDAEYHFDHPEVTGAAIMDVAHIPADTGLLLVHEDGTQERIDPAQTIALAPGRRFKKAPHFKRG